MTNPLVPYSTQQAFNVSTPSLSQTSYDYGAITLPLQASQEVTSAPSSQPRSPRSTSTLMPADSLSNSRVVSPVVTQGQTQAPYYPPCSTPALLLSEQFRVSTLEDWEPSQPSLAEKSAIYDDHTREEIAEGKLYEEQHSGDGAIGLQLLASGEDECLQHTKLAKATCQSTLAHSTTRSPSSPLLGESAGLQSSHYSPGSGQFRYSPSEMVNAPHSLKQEHPAPPDPVLSDYVNASHNPSSTTQEHVPALPNSSCVLKPPEKLDPTLSCWKSNRDKLSRLIDRLYELASFTRAEYRSQLMNQVVALRAMSKKHEERFKEFLQLSKEYANKYLLDISAEIQQERLFLDNLEGRVEAAKKFHVEVVDLKMRYDEGPVAAMNSLRATSKAVFCFLQKEILRL